MSTLVTAYRIDGIGIDGDEDARDQMMTYER